MEKEKIWPENWIFLIEDAWFKFRELLPEEEGGTMASNKFPKNVPLTKSEKVIWAYLENFWLLNQELPTAKIIFKDTGVNKTTCGKVIKKFVEHYRLG